MTLAERIRAFLKAQGDRRCTAAEIVAGVGCPAGEKGAKDRQRTYWSINIQVRNGFVDREGSGKSMRYWWVKDPEPVVKLSAEELARRRRARERARYVKRGGRTRAEWLAEKARAIAEREAARQKEREQREAARKAAWEARKAEEAKRLAARKPKPRPRPVVLPRMDAAPAPVREQRPETVEEFIARGGKVQRLANGVVSQPLKRIGKPEAFTIKRKAA